MYVSAINVFPVKSLAGISPRTARVERRGFEFDRRWMVVGEDGRFLTQRDVPKMATVSATPDSAGLILRSGSDEMRVPEIVGASDFLNVEIWGYNCVAAACAPEVNDWLSHVLGTSCRLMRMADKTMRLLDPAYAVQADDQVSFADAFPFLLVGEGSLADLNSRLESPVPMNRFRPNLVVSGSDAYAEDSWKQIKIGETVFHVVKPCARCVIPTIDQAEGIKTGVEPMRTLGAYRTFEHDGRKKILFGQNLIPGKAGGLVRIGDRVEVLAA